MAIEKIKDLKSRIEPGQRVLGVDLGRKTIGLAVSDTKLVVASPLTVIRRSRFVKDMKELTKIIKNEFVGGLIIGLPIDLNGNEGARCQSTRQFAFNFLQITNLPISFWDERFSTAAVERILVSEVDMSRARRAQVIDKMAAAFILQGALDSIN
ncbi:MAG: Holliday junction resolvase RuvX [Magnetovibrio sp.]|nr:Holliday junction resolvase RuvX [Magnetovibrio sp.]